MVFYRTKKYDYAQVVPVECESETAKFVVIGGRRNAKRSDYENYFCCESEAWQFLIAQHASSCEYHKRELHRYSTALGQCMAAAKKVEAVKTSHNRRRSASRNSKYAVVPASIHAPDVAGHCPFSESGGAA